MSERGERELCRVCRRRPAQTVCDGCRQRLAADLASLPKLAARLSYALVPAPGGSGEKVTASREAPLPVRLSALTLVAGGSDDARAVFVPKVRSWETTVDIAGQAVPVWQREPVRDEYGRPVMVLTDDQAGVLPTHTWLAKWTYEWRRTFGHSTRTVAPAAGSPRRSPNASLSAEWLTDDPLAQEWAARFGEPQWARLSATRHGYLSVWLAHACDAYPHIADFAVSLRALVGALRVALGDNDDLRYLGRCPEEITDRRTGAISICGVPLWHDPYVADIACPRCRTVTPENRRIWLARRILDVWPIDRRRRYHKGLIEILDLPACVTCGATVVVEWAPAMERGDTEPFWRPGAVTCALNACSEVLA